MSKVNCIYKYIITCYVFWLTDCRAFHSWGKCSTPYSVLKRKKKSVWGHFQAPLNPDAVLHSLKPQSTLQRGETKWQSPWKCIMWTLESPLLSTQPHCLTKQYWSHWSRTVLVIALPNRFEWKDMEAYYFGSVCDSMGTLLGRVIF